MILILPLSNKEGINPSFKKNMKDNTIYKGYEVEQWLEDADFLHWVKKPNDESDALFLPIWNENNDTSARMKTAADILHNIDLTERSLSDEEVADMWESIADRTIRRKERFSRIGQWARIASVAATVVLVVGLGWLWFMKKGSQPVDYLAMAGHISPASLTDIRLMMPGQEQISLSNRTEVILGNDGQMSLRTAKGDVISISGNAASAQKFGQLVVPGGQRASMVFADGSRVYVRPGSKVIFPVLFEKNRREIFVEGEAFLEVSKNKHRPFVVKTQKMAVEVLGTSFNVSAYPSHSVQSVVLVTGSVKVSSGDGNALKIKPNQRYSFDKSSQTEGVDNVDVYPYISWKDGILSFSSENLSSVLDKLSSYYGVTFDYKSNTLADIRLTGKLDLNNSVEEALKVIATTSPIQYQTGKTTIKIDVKP